jgi:hypothetical protein
VLLADNLRVELMAKAIVFHIKQTVPVTKWHRFSVHAYVFRAFGGILRATGAHTEMKLVPDRRFYWTTKEGMLRTYIFGVAYPIVHPLTASEIRSAARWVRKNQKEYLCALTTPQT